MILGIVVFVYNTTNSKYSNIYKYRSSASICALYSNEFTFETVFMVKINSDLGGFASINGRCRCYLEDNGDYAFVVRMIKSSQFS